MAYHDQLTGLPNRAQAAARYIHALDHPFNTPDAPTEVIEIGVSAGVTLHPEDGVTSAALLHAADAEMYAAKRARNPNSAREQA
jgi:GGDEF domain-containing protein